MNDTKKEVMTKLGYVFSEISFTSPKKVLYQSGGRDELIENVTSIIVMELAGMTSIEVNYNTDNGDGSMASSIKNIDKLVVMD